MIKSVRVLSRRHTGMILLNFKYKLKKIIEDDLHKLKSLRLVRISFYPIMKCVRNFKKNRFIKSNDSKRLQQFKQSHEGERCFIIGNGPSLNISDLEKITKDITFASNRIYNIYGQTAWRPDYYVAFEPTFAKDNIKLISDIEAKKGKFVNICAKSNRITDKNIYWFYSFKEYTLNKETTKGIDFSTDISQYVGESYSVTYTMIQIAVYMGFKEIYLLGVDHYAAGENTHFYIKNQAEYAAPTFLKGIEFGYNLAKQETKRRDIHIYNATRGGKLEVFERVDLDTLFPNNEEEK